MGRKRKNGEGAVRLRKDGRWEGRVVIGYDDKRTELRWNKQRNKAFLPSAMMPR